MIKVTVPAGTTTGTVMVVNQGKASNNISYTIDEGYMPPVINSINPGIAPSGETVIITGNYFGNAGSETCYVMFGNYKAVATQWGKTQIMAVVPEMPSGAIQVYVSLDGYESNKFNFTVQSKAVVIVPMVEIPPGSFMMGSDDPNKGGDAFPSHRVYLTNALQVAKTEISQAQYKKVMSQSNPSAIKDDNNPVEQLTFYQAIDFCNRLSKLEGLKECYKVNGENVTWDISANGYRLLTEAEWEYACRAGSTGTFGKRAGAEGNIEELAWTTDNTKSIQHIGLKKPNDFGLYDMHGNVAEWVWDYYDFYENVDMTNPTGPSEGVERCFRGGSYRDAPQSCTNFIRNAVNGLQYHYYIGFRVCRNK
jgi:formylglycine-generating enzyme required for sulfatase activity